MSKRNLSIVRGAAGLVLSGFISSSPSMAADEPSSTSETPSADIQTVVVTGSLLPTAPDQVAVPVTTVDAASLERNGVATNPLEMLRKAVPAFAGRSNTGTSNANNDNQRTAGGSQLQLRNLPTLILVNGRRIANSGIGGLNGKNFVDVNQIPAASIERIEVLTDGASSLYGSDAIGGVVNFILKSNDEGIRGGLRYGGADGGYHERSAFFTGGTSLGELHLFATGSYSKTDPLYQDARSFTSPLFNKTSSIPGTVTAGGVSPGAILAPTLNSPRQRNPTGTAATATSINELIANGTYVATTPAAVSGSFDVSPYQTLLLQQEQVSFVTNYFANFDDGKWGLFGDVMASRSRSFTQWMPIASTGNTVPAGAPFNPLTGAFGGVTFTYLPLPKQFDNEVKALRGTFGLRGQITDKWNWESGVVFSRSRLEQLQSNLLYKPNIARALAGGFDANGNAVAGGAYSKLLDGYSLTGALMTQPALDPFAAAAGVDPLSLARLYGNELLNAGSTLTSIDAKVVGPIFSLPADEVALAIGAAGRREKLDGHADNNGRVTDPVTGSTTGNDQQWLGGTFVDPFEKTRTIKSLFAELRVPITGESWNVPGARAFDLITAVRAEKYSDAGRSTVPKYGFRWQPFDKSLIVRGNYSESFSAPSLYAEYGPTATRQVGAGVIQGAFGANYIGMPFNGQDGNNPTLQPATSKSRSIGIVFHPTFLPGFSATVDFSSIGLHGFAGGLGFNNILLTINAQGSASPYFANLAVDGFPGTAGATQPFTQPGQLLAFITNPTTGRGDPAQANRLFLVDQFRNLANLIEHSYTFDLDYAFRTDHYGSFALSTTGAMFSTFSFQDLPGRPFIEYAGHSNNAGASGGFGGTLPKFRAYTTLDWTLKNVEFTLGNNYVSSTTDTGVNGNSTPEIPVASYRSWDARFAYDYRPEAGGSPAMTFALGVNNFTNEMPPLAARAFLDNNADVATFSPIGRLIYGTVTVTF